jgi:protein TonB
MLPQFLIASVALHVGFLAHLGQPLRIAPNWSLGHSVMDIRLQSAPPAPVPVPSARTVTRRRTDAPSARTAAPAKVVSDPSAPVSAAEASAASSMSAAETDAGLRNQLLGALHTRLSQYLTYPPLARHRGWEGTVLVGLRIESDGRLDEIRVERGSGYPILDHSALKSLNRLGRLAEAAPWLDGRSMDMQLAVVYRLIEN